MTMKSRTPEQIRIDGLRALRRELGSVGMVRFLHQFDRGSGDYTEERRNWRDQWTLDEIMRDLEAYRARKDAEQQ